MKSLKYFIIPVLGITLFLLAFQVPSLFGDNSPSTGTDEEAAILPYTLNMKGDQAIFLLSKGLNNWSSFTKPIDKDAAVEDTAAKCFTENTFFIFGNKDYILPKLKDLSLVRHPFKDSFLYVTPIDFKSSADFKSRLKSLMDMYGKVWMINKGAHQQHFKWVEETELLAALEKAQDRIITNIASGKHPSYVLNEATHHVAITTANSQKRCKLDSCLVEFLLTPRCQDILQKVVISEEGKEMIASVIAKNEAINEKLQFAHNHTIYSHNHDKAGHPRFKASRIQRLQSSLVTH
jgi:hypothetical protein